MTNNQNQPNQYDAVLGGNAPPPIHGAVLGGIEGVKKRLASSDVKAQLTALKEALNYEKEGLNIVIQALEDNRRKVREAAVYLLEDRNEPQAKSALKNYKFWDNFRIIYGVPSILLTSFDERTGITHTVDTALEELTDVKTIFIGEDEDSEHMISSITLPHVTPILQALPRLEVLKIRGNSHYRYGGEALIFNPSIKHDNLKALTIQSGGLSREAITQLCQLELPALEYLELWLGSYEYGGTSSIEYIMPIISGKFSKLKYLGMRNSEYSDEIAFALIDSPIIENLIELDFSMGTLTDEGAEALLNCPSINQLDTLNISENYLTNEMLEQLNQLDIEVINIGWQKYFEDDDNYRYCTVGE